MHAILPRVKLYWGARSRDDRPHSHLDSLVSCPHSHQRKMPDSQPSGRMNVTSVSLRGTDVEEESEEDGSDEHDDEEAY